MRGRLFQIGMALIYASVLLVTYVFNISQNWSYMGFQQIGSVWPVVASLFLSSTFAAFIPVAIDTRSFLLTVLHYTFFIPSFLILASIGLDFEYLFALVICFFFVFSTSSLPLRTLGVTRLTRKAFFAVVGILLTLSVALMAAYGGLGSFNLNIFEVYEFRREASAGMPAVFSYLFSGVSKVVAPMSLALAIYFRSTFLFMLSSICIILLFGMTSHKSVLFLPVFVVAFFLALQKAKSIKPILYLLIGVGFVSIMEIIYTAILSPAQPGLYNTFIIRRALFVPPLLDSLYIEFFRESQKLYWSTSRFSLGISDNPYDLSAPFLIGREFFGRDEMSANTGIIGSGFSHAGYVGVMLYSVLAGLLLAFLRAYGRIVGHPLISAASLSIFVSIVTSTDFATAILTHGLLLLIVLLMFFPKEGSRKHSGLRGVNDHPLHHRPSTR